MRRKDSIASTKGGKVFTVNEIAEKLKVHPQTVYRWIYQGKLKSLKIHSSVRITEEQYEEFIKEASNESP